MKERKRPCALTAFSIRLGCVIFLFWLLGLAAITLAISQYIFQGLSEKGIDYAEYAAMVGGLDRLFSAEEEAADGRSATVSVSGDSQTPPYTRAELDAMGLLAWDVYFDETASAVMPADAVTIYAFSPEIFVYDAGGPVRYQGSERHENLLALLKTMGFYQNVGRNRFYSGASQFSLWNMIVFSSWQRRFPVGGIYAADCNAGQPAAHRRTVSAQCLSVFHRFCTCCLLAVAAQPEEKSDRSPASGRGGHGCRLGISAAAAR